MVRWSAVTLVINLVIACIINTTAMLVSGTPISFIPWFMGTSSAFCVNVLIQLVIPVPDLAKRAAQPLGESMLAHAFELLVTDLIYMIIMSASMTALATGGNHFVEAWLGTFPILMAVSYVTVVVIDVVMGALMRAQAQKQQ
ncbi:hypothetical protein KPC83_04885 [Collinsella sp. zg1085]|uniref:hypothetical protein n=1 Tax=Collinsella sp. zg1085 TaxID=2844380 RepID=UPI001C0C66E7|nr:hypothetical protein [Collinsella sp. zg1085]QWT17180.1 hypothetical protein KPC83_04885 [Collinsella sp. zg1085]